MSRCLARRRSFFNSRDLYGVGLRHLGSGLPQPETHLPEDPLALTHAQSDAIALAQVLGEQFAVPQMTGETKCPGVTSQVAPQCRPLFSVQCRRPARAFALAHSLQSMALESLDPALDRTAVFAEKLCHLVTALAAGHRPCNECRPANFKAFKAAWLKANLPGQEKLSAIDLDAAMHRERTSCNPAVIADIQNLPTGSMVQDSQGAFYLVRSTNLLQWTPDGYRTPLSDAEGPFKLVTPPSLLKTLQAGYEPLAYLSVFRPHSI